MEERGGRVGKTPRLHREAYKKLQKVNHTIDLMLLSLQPIVKSV